jgi:ribosome recycling factor
MKGRLFMSYDREHETKMQKTIAALINELAAIRAGRANPAILDKLRVDYYGAPTPISQMAAISVAEARTIIIQPWDSSTLRGIEKAILTSDLGINPQNDGKIIRISFPQLTEERRKDLVKLIHKYVEDAKVAVRAIRRDAIEGYKEMKKKSLITEDDLKDNEKDIQDMTDRFSKEIDDIAAKKEKELMDI